MINDWAGIINQVAFPILISCYLLFRFENIIKRNTKMVEALITKIDLIHQK